MHHRVSFRLAIPAIAALGLLFGAGCAMPSASATHLNPSVTPETVTSGAQLRAKTVIGGRYRWEIYNGSNNPMSIRTNQSICMAKTVPTTTIARHDRWSGDVETDAEHGDCWLAWTESAFSVVYEGLENPKPIHEAVYSKSGFGGWKAGGESGNGYTSKFRAVVTYPDGLKTTTYQVTIY